METQSNKLCPGAVSPCVPMIIPLKSYLVLSFLNHFLVPKRSPTSPHASSCSSRQHLDAILPSQHF